MEFVEAMIKFRATDDKNQPILGIGLSRENCNRLLEGQPIVLWPQETNIDWPGSIVIFAGEDEQSMTKELRDHGMLKNVPIHTFKEKQ